MAARRWYDDEPDVQQSIDLMEKFPPEIQEIVGEGAVTLAERECQARDIMSSLRSLGAERILSIYKSQNKQRAYDQSPSFHKMVNYMLVISPENRRFLARQISRMVVNISEYFKSCRYYDVEPDAAEVAEMTRAYVEMGSEDARRFLDKLKEDFRQGIRKRSEVLVADAGKSKSLMDADQGMRIREE